MNTDQLSALQHRQLDATYKGLPLGPGERISAHDIASRNWNVLAGDLDLPVMVIKETALASNLAVMSDYCRHNMVDLAPHGKTSMAPQLFARQLEAGAWAITAANIAQCRVYRAFGVPRILLANELVDAQAIRWIAAEQFADPDFEFLCFVDSSAGVELADSVLADAGGGRPLDVLVEFGYAGGRAGCRTIGDAVALAEMVGASRHLRLRGVAGFEGLIPGTGVEDVMAGARRYLEQIRSLVLSIDAAGLFPADEEVIVSAGGSSYFDVVAEVLGRGSFDRRVRPVLRSGCYITHDDHMFESTSPFGRRAATGTQRLTPAFELWATCLSRPEPELAIVGFGKRDAPYDYGLPIPRLVRSMAGVVREVDDAYAITHLNDQHAFMTVPSDDTLGAGDVVVLGISHPCTAFDKWRYVPVVDDAYNVIDGVFTFF